MNQYQLNEIVLYRAVVTLLLILTHSFTIFGGAWPYPPGIEPCNLYMWIVRFAAHAMLGGFTFISGYLLVHQKEKILQQSYKVFISKKLQRVLLPGILFSVLYIWMFEEHSFSTLLNFSYTLSAGHMWYLPMLMWCLILGYYLLKHNISLKKMVWISGIGLFLYFLPLPFGLSRFLYYAIYFILGMMAYHYKNVTILKSKLLLNWVGYLFIFIFATIIILHLNSIFLRNPLLKLIVKETCTYIRVLSGIVGVWVYWRASLYITNRHVIPFWIQSISRYSFSIYLYQQFILQVLFYHSSIPQKVGTIPLPWLSFAITILLSWFFAFLTSKTKVGKYLLG